MQTPPDSTSREELKTLYSRLDRASHNIALLEQRLERLENSIIFRLTRGIGNWANTYRRRLGQHLLHSPFHGLYLRLRPANPANDPYTATIERRESAFSSIESYAEQTASWAWKPRISVVMPTYNPRREWLQAAIDSVVNQSYPSWQLCICDDGSDGTWVGDYLASRADADARIRWLGSNERAGISGALNRAGSLVSGDYVAFLDHDDVLHRHALFHVANAAQQHRPCIIYSDEDYLDETELRVRPQFKPDWSPDLLLSCMYFGHLFVAERQAIERVGWFRSCCDGAQDYDLALRLTDTSVEVRHIPLVLYHWRKHPSSTALSISAKPYTHAAGKKALSDALERRGIIGTVENGPFTNTYYIRRGIPEKKAVSIVVCSRDPKLLNRCLRSIRAKTEYPHIEVVVVRHEQQPNAGFDPVLKRYAASGIRYTRAFNFARMNNEGVAAAAGDIIVLINDDVQPLHSDWLEHLVGHIQRPEVGVAGAKLLYPSGAIQHAGMVTGILDGAGHPARGLFRSDECPWLDLTRNVSAVTGACLGVRASVFRQLGGFDEGFPSNYNDVDFCLRARKQGYLIVYEPRAVLRHDECRSRIGRTRFYERERFYERWADILNRPDPYYSPAFDSSTEEIRIADPPHESIMPSP